MPEPTVIGAPVPTPTQVVEVTPTASQIVPLNTGSIVLRPEQVPLAEQKIASLDFGKMSPGDIINIGLDTERALQKTLDGFLARLDKNKAAKVFQLFDLLQNGVEDANLPEILKKVQTGEKPGFWRMFMGRLSGKKPAEIVRAFMNEIGDFVAGKTETLADKMNALEADLTKEMKNLFDELKTLDGLSDAYGSHFKNFVLDAAVASAFLVKAKDYVAAEEAKANPSDVVEQARVRELKDKLQLLESRALNLEGSYTRMPANQDVIQEIKQAGVVTLQETASTISSRFASIKMALLTIHASFAVKSVQQLDSSFASIDAQLQSVNAQARRDIAVTANLAPGLNRVAQAEQIQQIIRDTVETRALVDKAKEETARNFELAREKFAEARKDLIQAA